jgi:hypothetical protein
MRLVPELERANLDLWRARIDSEGLNVQGQLCPQRELDTSGEFPGFERAVAGISFSAQDQRLSVPAYSRSRPDIRWDEVQIAVFGRVPPSALMTGLRQMFFLGDPLLEVTDCQSVTVRYVEAEPAIFALPDRFQTEPSTGGVRKAGRTVVLTILWFVWWMVAHGIISAVLGLARSAPEEDSFRR